MEIYVVWRGGWDDGYYGNTEAIYLERDEAVLKAKEVREYCGDEYVEVHRYDFEKSIDFNNSEYEVICKLEED